jgi:hypothetical protein
LALSDPSAHVLLILNYSVRQNSCADTKQSSVVAPAAFAISAYTNANETCDLYVQQCMLGTKVGSVQQHFEALTGVTIYNSTGQVSGGSLQAT